jgi:hypothetical protein
MTIEYTKKLIHAYGSIKIQKINLK